MLDDLRIAADDRNAGLARRDRHRLDFALERTRREAGLEDERRHERHRFGSRDGQIVERSVHGEFSDRPARKAQRLDHEAVRGRSNARALDRQRRRVRERLQGRIREVRTDQTFDETPRRGSAGTVCHFDLRVREARGASRALDRRHAGASTAAL